MMPFTSTEIAGADNFPNIYLTRSTFPRLLRRVSESLHIHAMLHRSNMPFIKIEPLEIVIKACKKNKIFKRWILYLIWSNHYISGIPMPEASHCSVFFLLASSMFYGSNIIPFLSSLKFPWNENWFSHFVIRFVLLLFLPIWQNMAQQWPTSSLQFWFLFYSQAFPGKWFKNI